MTGRQDLFQQAMNQGHSAAWDQDWEKAAAYYRQALEEFPDQPQALSSYGLALYELQDYDQALQVYQRAARVIPNDPLPLEKVAQLRERLGNLEAASQASLQAAELYLKNRDANKAIENWKRVTRLSPENMQAHSRLAMVYERTNEKEKAVSEYIAVASLLQSKGDLEKAMLAVNRAMQVCPESENARQATQLLKSFKPLPKPVRPKGGTAPLRMAQVRQLQKPQDSSQEQGLDPVAQARQKALTHLAGMLFEVIDDTQEDSARRGLQSIMRGLGSSRTIDRTSIVLHLSQVVDLQTNGQNSQASKELAEAIEAGLASPAAYFDLGYLLAEEKKIEAALQNLQMAVNDPDFSLGAHLLKGSGLYELERFKEAAVEYLEALKLADGLIVPDDQAAGLRQLYEPLVEAQRASTDTDAQLRLCENIHELLMQPDWEQRLVRARQQLPARGDASQLLPLAEVLTEARSSQVIESLSTIYELANHGNMRSAMEEAFYALDYAPTYLPLHTYMGELLLKEDRLDDAIEKFLTVANAYSIRGEYNQSIALYRRIVELAPINLDARQLMLQQLITAGRMEEALNGYLELAEVYYSLADIEKARQTYTETMRLSQQAKVDRSWRVKILHRMADIDLQSLDWRQALRHFDQIRTLQPDDEKARAGLIEINYRLGQESEAMTELDNYIAYLEGLGNKAKILEFVQGLLSENPDRIQFRIRLAEAYRRLGQVKEALEEFDAVGEALLEAGDRAGAARAVQAILALNPPNKAGYMNLLATLK